MHFDIGLMPSNMKICLAVFMILDTIRTMQMQYNTLYNIILNCFFIKEKYQIKYEFITTCRTNRGNHFYIIYTLAEDIGNTGRYQLRPLRFVKAVYVKRFCLIG